MGKNYKRCLENSLVIAGGQNCTFRLNENVNDGKYDGKCFKRIMTG